MRSLARIAASLLDGSRKKQRTRFFGAVPVLPMAANMLAKIKPVSQWRNKRRLCLNCISAWRVERGYLAAQVRKKEYFGGGAAVFQSANKHTLTLRVSLITTLTNNKVEAMNSEISNNNKPDHSDMTDSDTFDVNADSLIGAGDAVDVLAEKLSDAMIPGAIVEFDPDEAERIGAFQEDALDEADALESSIDLDNIG